MSQVHPLLRPAALLRPANLLVLAIAAVAALAGPSAAHAAACTSTVSTVAAAQSQVTSAPAGSVVCLSSGTYGKLNLSGAHSGEVIVQPVPGSTVNVAGVHVLANSSRITVRNFVITNEVDIDNGSSFINIDHNDISGGYFGVQLYSYDCAVPNAPTWSGCQALAKVTDVQITGNRFHGFAGSAEDAIHLNNFARVTIAYNEISGVIESGNHNDCLQTVFGGSDLVFDHNYLHDNNCQGFFIKDGDVTNVTVTENLFVRNKVANLAENTLQIYNTKNLVMRNNTDWSNNGEVLRSAGSSFTPTAAVDHNVLQTFNIINDSPPSVSMTENNNIFGTNPWTFTRNSSSTVSSSPAFVNPATDDYRIAGSDRGVTWRPADYIYGPTDASTADTTAPNTTINSAPPASTASPSASIVFSATETATFQCRIDGGAWGSCTSPKAYAGLAVGGHTFDVRATDSAGNVDATPATASWTVTAPDTIAPDTTITSGPPGSTTSTSASLVFSATETATFECRIDGGAWVACTSPKSYSSLATGGHTFDVRATDGAGNVDASPATLGWTVTAPADTTAPDTTITSGPAASTTSTSATLAFSSTEAGSTFECRLDGGAWAACTSPKGYSALALGGHTVDVRATDTAGNTDASPASRNWTVTAGTDTTPPDTSITSGPSGSTTSTSASFVFSATEPATFECRLDGGAWGSCTSPKAYSALATGAHTFTVRATDTAGNVDLTPASRGWSITAPTDTTAPETSITSGPAGTTTATSATLAFSSTESGSTFQCRIDGGSWSSCTSPTDYSALSVGGHTFDVRATDASGNTDASPATRSWTVVAPAPDTTAPDTVITVGPSGTTTETTASVSFTSTESGSSFACRLDGGPWSPCSSPEGFSSLAAGAHTIDVRATDAAGNADASPASRSWTVAGVPDPTPPPAGDTTSPDTTITSGPATITSSRSAAFAFTATETPTSLECSLDSRRWARCNGPKTYTGLDRGRHLFRVRSTDAAGNVDATPAEYRWSIVRRWSGTYWFESLSNGKTTDTVRADSLEGACALVPSSRSRLAVRLKGTSVKRSGGKLKVRGKVPELAVDGVKARVRVSIRSHGRWRLLVSRRVNVRFDGAFTLRAPKRGGKLKVTAVVRCD